MKQSKYREDESDAELDNQREDLESRMMRVDEMRTLFNLHNDVWEDALLEPPFLFYYLKVLYPRERQIVDKKVTGTCNEDIAGLLGVTLSTVQRAIYNIRYVFRNKARPRVNKFWRNTSENHFTNWRKGRWYR